MPNAIVDALFSGIFFILHPHRPVFQAKHFCADVDEVTQLLKKLLGQ